ncbi:MAG: DUF6089 family protein [Bacteroidetes bacterium]|nr:DUF6089 family protein [Bacteroidota bacterium]
MMNEKQAEKSVLTYSGVWIHAIAVSLFWLSGSNLPAQSLEAGLYGGGCYYLGDLNPGKHFMNYNIAYGVMLRYVIDDRWAVKLSAYRGKVKGNASQSNFMPERDLSFSSPVTDISAVAEFNFFDFYVGSRKNWITPYIYAGFSFFMFNPQNGGVDLQSIGTEGQLVGYEGRTPYKKYSFGIPFGIGVKVSLARRVGLAVFWEMHKTFTDYLDDVSKTYYLDGSTINKDDPSQILSDPTMSYNPGMQRGNSRNNDWYSFSGVTLTYKFNLVGRKRCRDLEH